MKLALLALGLIVLGGCAVGPDYGYVRPDGDYYGGGYSGGVYDNAYYDDGYYYRTCGDCGSVSIGFGYGYPGYGGYPYYAYPYYGGYYYYGGYGHHHHDHHDHGDHDGDDHHDSWHHHDHGDARDPDEHDHDGPNLGSPLAWRHPEQVPSPQRNELTPQGGFVQTPMYRAPAIRIATPARGSGSASAQPPREPPHVRSTRAPEKQVPRR